MRLSEVFGTTEALAEIFSDHSVLRAMLEFERSLARAEARLEIIPQRAAGAIAAAADAPRLASASLSRDSHRSGTLGVPFSQALVALVSREDPEAAGYVHWGATSQDLSDTALVLLLKRATPLIAADLTRAESALRRLSDEHRDTIMLGRTFMQPAPPITFGLKAAGWFAAVRRCQRRLEQACAGALVLQLGGATGTLAALGEQGPAVAQALADELGLPLPDAPWHAHRDRLAALVCACGVLTGSLGKIARDISLMSQHEVGEVAEPAGEGRGGSSTMPHKRNPVGCAMVLGAATRVPALVASYLSTMPQENERGIGGPQAEWPIVTQVIQATGAAANAMAEVLDGLTVDVNRMRKNLEATKGAVFAEKAAIVLGRKIGRKRAHEVLAQATRAALAEQKSLADVLRATPAVRTHLDPAELNRLEAPEDYLGSAEWFRRRLLESSAVTREH
jgi:3-carboxy-cis,cis-muconate cycloisomerase